MKKENKNNATQKANVTQNKKMATATFKNFSIAKNKSIKQLVIIKDSIKYIVRNNKDKYYVYTSVLISDIKNNATKHERKKNGKVVSEYHYVINKKQYKQVFKTKALEF